MQHNKNLSPLFILSFTTILLFSPSKQDCFCGSRDVTPSKFGFNAKDSLKGHQANLNMRLNENYQIASIVNYIDVFLSKFNRLNLKKPSWPVPLKISGVQNLNFFHQKEGFNTMMTHRISQNLFLEVRIEMYNTYKTKGQFNLFATLVRRNFKGTMSEELKKGAKISKDILNYPLKRAHLSHFYGNQLAVDVCRFMYASVNKVLVDFFDVNLQGIVYKEIGTNLRSHKYKKECVEMPSFKVYLGVNQINQMITDTRQKMEEAGVVSSEALEQKLKEMNDKGQNLSQIHVPKLQRRKSNLLTPIFMNKDGAEMLAEEYEGTQEYQHKIREVYQMEYQEFLDQEIDLVDDSQNLNLIDEKKLLEKSKSKVEVMGQDFSPKQLKPEEEKEFVQISTKDQREKILQPLNDFSPQARFEKLERLVSQSRLEREDDINNLEKLITQAIVENFDRLPKSKEARSEGYLKELKKNFTVQMKNNEVLREKLGIDLDEDELELNPEQKKQITEFLNDQFVLLRTTPLQTNVNSNFRAVFGKNKPLTQNFVTSQTSKKGIIFGRSNSLPSDFFKTASTETINLIGRNEVIVISKNEDFNENQILQEGLSQNSEFEFTIDAMELKPREYHEETVEVMFSQNDFKEQKDIYNPDSMFLGNQSLSPEEREQTIKQIIELTNFIYQNQIKCDFELYTDRTIFLNMPDLEVSQLLTNLNMIVEAGTQEQLPVIVTTEPMITSLDQTSIGTQEVVNEKTEHNQPKEYFAEISMEIPGYTKEQVQQMIVQMMEEEAFLTIGETKINGEKQDELNQLHLVGYDITDHLANDLNEL
jgi:hypothetical protein